jgi:hypothetical protein
MTRLLLSEWFGAVLTLLLGCVMTYTVRSDRGPTPLESALSYTGIAALIAWLFAYGIKAWRHQR